MSNADNRPQYSSYALYIPPGLPVPAKGRSWGGPRPVLEERPGPRWLDRREQNALLRAVERAGKPRDLKRKKALYKIKTNQPLSLDRDASV